ncbi:MAG: EscU/YscU/HrcU family type III secretion system export apparatus switch protein [Alphaproteobacteria bacterium]|jgi:flagellar biosynthesis protein|nr:EscU/YscU/HrcU family type III secretion system export apparatus switch protein [Candidatus Jidaibacter sp.]
MSKNSSSYVVDKLTAIAVKYNRDVDVAPKIIEKGQGLVAQEILNIAKDHNIPIVQNEEVAQILKRCEIDSFIPVEAYFLIAQILSKIFSYKKDEYH